MPETITPPVQKRESIMKQLMTRMTAITADEIRLKLNHLGNILKQRNYNAILFNQEGAMRWLTGIKHQVGDIAPSAVSPVNALVRLAPRGSFSISLISSRFEMPRVMDQIPAVFAPIPEIKYDFLNAAPPLTETTLAPGAKDYQEVVDLMVRPILGGLDGHPYKKLAWLTATTMGVLAATAHQLRPGEDGLEVRTQLLHNLSRHGIDANLVLIGLAGQEQHLHPVASADYRVEPDRWLKLVVGSRLAEHIVSQSLMVKLGGRVTEQEQVIYHALQDATVEYADCYRTGMMERDIYAEMLSRFQKIEDKYRLKGFAASATLHHPGGGTSPLGGRDRMLAPTGGRTLVPWTQFAINPVDVLAAFKVELQGIVQPESRPPLIPKMSGCAEGLTFRKVVADGGTMAELPELLIV